MQRDRDGCCAAVREPWYHYHLFLGGFLLNGEVIIPYGQSWGNNARSIMKWIRPTPGNHDFEVRSGMGYYRYFGDRAGPAGKGYYSYDLGQWHVIALNSELTIGSVSDAGQEEWLRKDLKDHAKPCTMAYFHKPLFS